MDFFIFIEKNLGLIFFVSFLSFLFSPYTYTMEKNQEKQIIALKGWNCDDVDLYNTVEKFAKQGHKEALFLIGDFYYYHPDVQQGDMKKLDLAVVYYSKAAEKGHVTAQFQMGNILDYNNIDPYEAREYYKLAADQGHRGAQCSLGFMYYYGRGGDVNIKEAFRYCQLAVDQEYIPALFQLGQMYQCSDEYKNLSMAIGCYFKGIQNAREYDLNKEGKYNYIENALKEFLIFEKN